MTVSRTVSGQAPQTTPPCLGTGYIAQTWVGAKKTGKHAVGGDDALPAQAVNTLVAGVESLLEKRTSRTGDLMRRPVHKADDVVQRRAFAVNGSSKALETLRVLENTFVEHDSVMPSTMQRQNDSFDR